MPLSAREQRPARVTQLRTDGLMAEVTRELAGGRRRVLAEALGLAEGQAATAVVTSTGGRVAT